LLFLNHPQAAQVRHHGGDALLIDVGDTSYREI